MALYSTASPGERSSHLAQGLEQVGDAALESIGGGGDGGTLVGPVVGVEGAQVQDVADAEEGAAGETGRGAADDFDFQAAQELGEALGGGGGGDVVFGDGQ